MPCLIFNLNITLLGFFLSWVFQQSLNVVVILVRGCPKINDPLNVTIASSERTTTTRQEKKSFILRLSTARVFFLLEKFERQQQRQSSCNLIRIIDRSNPPLPRPHPHPPSTPLTLLEVFCWPLIGSFYSFSSCRWTNERAIRHLRDRN